MSGDASSMQASRGWIQRSTGLWLGTLPLIIFVALLLYLSVSSANFLTLSTLDLILRQAIPTVIVCLGLSVVVMAGGDDVVSGGIDLSVPATAVLAAAIIADQISLHDTALGVAILLAMAAALAVGAVNAFLVVWVGMTPLLATLATSVAVIGIVKVITASRRINVDHQAIIWLRDGELAGVSVGVLVTLIFFIVYFWAVHRTRWGMNLQAVGGSRDAAEVSGISPKRYISQSFLVAAFAGGLAAMFILARGSGFTPGTEENLLLEMVLATFLGAAFSPRRVVTLWGAVLGAVLVSALSLGFKSIGVNVFWTGCIKGALILVVVASASLSGRVRP